MNKIDIREKNEPIRNSLFSIESIKAKDQFLQNNIEIVDSAEQIVFTVKGCACQCGVCLECCGCLDCMSKFRYEIKNKENNVVAIVLF